MQQSDIDPDVDPFINYPRRMAVKCGTLFEQVDSGDETENLNLKFVILKKRINQMK